MMAWFLHYKLVILLLAAIVIAFRCLWLPAKWRGRLCKACRILDAHFEAQKKAVDTAVPTTYIPPTERVHYHEGDEECAS